MWSGDIDPAAVRPAQIPATPAVLREESGDFLPPLSAFSAILDRPIFRPDRRPEPEVVIETPEQTTGGTLQDTPEFVIIGTVTGPGGGAATIRSRNETRRVYVGDTVEGWRIDTITGNGIEVSQDGDRFRLSIGEPE